MAKTLQFLIVTALDCQKPHCTTLSAFVSILPFTRYLTVPNRKQAERVLTFARDLSVMSLYTVEALKR